MCIRDSLKEGFYQIPISVEDRHKTTINTPWGSYQYCRMPFGLRNAPPTFQRYMNIVLEGLQNVLVYIDDIIIFTETYEKHLQVIRQVFTRLLQYGLIINLEKSEFCQTKVTYLGFEFTSSGYRPVDLIIPKLTAFAVPTTKKMVMRFLGIVNYYRNHVPGLAAVAAPLYQLLSSQTKIKWTPECQSAFDKVKEICQDRILLVPYREGGKLELYTDASDVAAGAVLLQDGYPLEFFSRRFSPTEQRYSTNEREALALVSSVLHFKTLLIGRPFVAYTDHIALTRWLYKEPVSERHARWLTKVQDLIFEIKYVPGEQNIFADLMSRPEGVQKSTRRQLLESLHPEAVVHNIDVNHGPPMLESWAQSVKDEQQLSDNLPAEM